MVVEILVLVFGSIIGIVGSLVGIRYKRYTEDMKSHKEDLDEAVLDRWLQEVNHQIGFLNGRGIARYVKVSGRDDKKYKLRERNLSFGSGFPPDSPLWRGGREHWPDVWTDFEAWCEDLGSLDSEILEVLREFRNELIDDNLSWGPRQSNEERAKRKLVVNLWNHAVRQYLGEDYDPTLQIQPSDPVQEAVTKGYRSPKALYYSNEILVVGEKSALEELKERIEDVITSSEYHARLDGIFESASKLSEQGKTIREELRRAAAEKTVSNRCDLCPPFFSWA